MFVDLHIHSRFSRACSPDITLANLEKYARLKGLDVLATGDITHPEWVKELRTLEERDGLLVSTTGFRFLLAGEVSNVYQQDQRTRKIHNIILVRSFEVLEAMNKELSRRADLSSDGRPTLGMSCPDLVDLLKSTDKRIEVIPAHIWTPWFSLFGSVNGFDSIDGCFQDTKKHLFALETGLSADPAMCSLLSSLDDYSIVSFSDSHSYWPFRMGREATELECEPSFDSIIDSLRKRKVKRTIEFFPEEGKYHYDGHRKCGISLHPRKALQNKNLCPKCGRRLTLGVLHRVLELADREEPKAPHDFVRLVPLQETIASVLGAGVHSKAVWESYDKIVSHFGSELSAVLGSEDSEIISVAGQKVGKAMVAMRNGKVQITPGYDGEYGKVSFQSQRDLTSFTEPRNP